MTHTEYPILDRSYDFAVRIVKLYKYLNKTFNERILSAQVLKSGTSIGANVSEAQRGQSKADFHAKMSIALKEANETDYWLKLLYSTDYLSDKQFESLNKDIMELFGILIAICKTTDKAK